MRLGYDRFEEGTVIENIQWNCFVINNDEKKEKILLLSWTYVNLKYYRLMTRK